MNDFPNCLGNHKGMKRSERSHLIQEENEGWDNNRERVLYDTESFLSPLIKAIESMENSDAGKHPSVKNIIAQIDAFIASERDEKRIAEKIAAMDNFDTDWHNKFWYGHKDGLFGLAQGLHQKHGLQ